MASSAPASSSIRVIHRTDQSLAMLLLHTFIRPFRNILMKPKQRPGGSPQLEAPNTVHKVCIVTERRIDGIFVYDLEPKNVTADRKVHRRVYYIAGGSWQMPPGKQHWRSVARIAEKFPNTAVTLLSPPLGPHSPAPVAFPQLLDLYAELMRLSTQADEEVIWMGDSSGGNIVLALTIEALRIRPNLPVPAAVVGICPSTDLTRENPQIKEIAKVDPILSLDLVKRSAGSWTGDWDPKDPRLSPRFANLQPLAERNVKVHGITAGKDVLSPDGIVFRELLQEAGVKGEWLEWDKQMHCFPLTWMYGLKEGKEGFEWLLALLGDK